MTKKYTKEEHEILAGSTFKIGEEFHRIAHIIRYDAELVQDLIDATQCLKEFCTKMAER